MKKILILGHNGMLGNAVYRYFSSRTEYEVVTISARYGDSNFETEIRTLNPEYIINCIGIIPQRKQEESLYEEINVNLPIFLETLGVKIIHPSTDCEFIGNIALGETYSKQDMRNAEDLYGKSKAYISEQIENNFHHTKIIRTSIIGHELKNHVALLDWFLHSEGEVSGFSNKYWSGITTLEWAKLAHSLIEKWDVYPTLNQYATDCVSKYELLCLAKDVYQKDITITKKEHSLTENKCLSSDIPLPLIRDQLEALKKFYEK
ncbi:MAG: UDP-6-deoxy-4-keto-L-IdoNAc 3-epimerase / UDP-4-keto-L-RhaNAc 4-reductase [Candidatus Parcubacteria bacterium]|jgi:dTDP-4-dehydrorhamnose reductase